MTAFCYIFTNQIVSVFLTEQSAFDYAVQFARILLSTSTLFGVFYVLTNAIEESAKNRPVRTPVNVEFIETEDELREFVRFREKKAKEKFFPKIMGKCWVILPLH